MADRPARYDRVLAPAADAVDLQRRTLPESLESAVTGLTVAVAEADAGKESSFVEGHAGYLAAASGGERRDAVVEARHGDPTVGVVQAGQDLTQRVQRVGHGAAVSARVQVAVGARHDDVHRDQAFRRKRE